VMSGTQTTGLETISTNYQVDVALSDVAAGTEAVRLTSMGGANLKVQALGSVRSDGTTTDTTADTGDLSSDHTGTTTLDYSASSRNISLKTAQSPLADYSFSESSA